MNTKTVRKWAIVDDEPALLALYQLLLERTVPNELALFQNPLEAATALRDEPGAFELLITDRAMPGIDGVQLLKAVRPLAPHLRFLIVTGNPWGLEEELEEHALPCSYLVKPFILPDLMHAAERALVLGGSRTPVPNHPDQASTLDGDAAALSGGYRYFSVFER